jgi:nucleoside-diphosphate-sugar epimerase
MRILITGDKGFVGTETVKHLEGHQVLGFDIMDNRDIRDAQLLDRFKLETGTNPSSCRNSTVCRCRC